MSKHLFERIKLHFLSKSAIVCCSVSCVQLTHDKVGIYLQGWQCRRTVGEVCCESLWVIWVGVVTNGWSNSQRFQPAKEQKISWISWNHWESYISELKLTSKDLGGALEPSDLDIQSPVFTSLQGWSTYSEWRRWGSIGKTLQPTCFSFIHCLGCILFVPQQNP